MDLAFSIVVLLVLVAPPFLGGYLAGCYHERSKLRQRWRRNQVLPTITLMRQDR